MKQIVTVALIGGTIALAGGCGGNGNESADAPARAQTTTAAATKHRAERALFQQHCGGCHTLADAGTHGTGAGSEADLDAIHANISTVENYLNHKIGKMPDFRRLIAPPERRALALYIAEVDGCGTSSPTSCDP